MTLTFSAGIPALTELIVTPYGPAQVVGFAENGTVDIDLGYGRVYTVSSTTEWRPRRPARTGRTDG